MKVTTTSTGQPRQTVQPLPEHLTVTVTRNDGYLASPPEIYAALKIALEAIGQKRLIE